MNCFDEKSFLDDFHNSKKILLGIGESFQVKLSELEQIPLFLEKRDELRVITDGDWYYPFLIRYFLKPFFHVKKEEIYKSLLRFIKDKDCFIVVLTTDDILRNLEIEESFRDRIVYPCGSYEIMQCPECCSEELFEVPDEFSIQFAKWIEENVSELPEPLTCRHCGKKLVFNQVCESHYLETGYMKQWDNYKKWLQETMNDNLMMIELGVGMAYPSVIRWPWEKISMYQLKSKFYRVNKQLFQLPENANENSCSVKMDPEIFIKSIF